MKSIACNVSNALTQPTSRPIPVDAINRIVRHAQSLRAMRPGTWADYETYKARLWALNLNALEYEQATALILEALEL